VVATALLTRFLDSFGDTHEGYEDADGFHFGRESETKPE
jgi:hypothetical protein